MRKRHRFPRPRSSFETTGADVAASVDAASVLAQTALHKAVLYDFRDCVMVLLSAGASPDIADNRTRGPLHSAVTRNNRVLTKILLKFGANPNLRDAGHKTLLERDALCEGRKSNKECIAIVEAAVARPKVRRGPAHHLNRAARIGTGVDANREIKIASGFDAVAAAPKLDTTAYEDAAARAAGDLGAGKAPASPTTAFSWLGLSSRKRAPATNKKKKRKKSAG